MTHPATTRRDYDAIVIGGGPAGCSAAAVLAEKGRRVVVVEKEGFPRYKVGESLIPYCWFPLKRIGMVEELRRSSFVEKCSVQFVGLDGRVSQPFYFFKHTDHECSRTWQVVRSEFDQMLLQNAVGKGAEALLETQAKRLIRENDAVVGIEAVGRDGQSFELRAPMTVDASGRDTFAVRSNDWRRPDEKLKKMAVWTYYKGARRDEGIDAGATTVAYLPDKGWFWYIPLPDDVVSVGVVAEGDYLYRGERHPQNIFDREAVIQPWIHDHLSTGRRIGECRVTSDYSYRSEHCAADGLVLAGDAFAFLDPVFSSGVFLALQSGVMAGDAVHEALWAGDVSAGRFAQYGQQLCAGVEAMRKLVYGFYDTTFSFGKLLKKHPNLRHDLTDCLIGNLFRDFDPLFEAMAEFARIPEPLSHGRPMITAGAK